MFEALFKYSRDIYARSELVYAADWPAWLPGMLGMLALVGIALLLYRRRSVARWYQLLAIGFLQCAMLAVVLWVLQLPTLSTEQLRAGENSVALVLDNSQSMAYGEEEPRLGQAIRSLESVSESGDPLNLSVRRYEMGGNAVAVPSYSQSVADQATTSIAGSLLQVMREARFSPLAAVVLSSDGADTDGGLTAEELDEIAAFGVPVHTIAVGRTVIGEDLEIATVSMPAKVLPGSAVSARISVRHDSAATTQLKVYDGDNLLAVQALELSPDAGVTNARVNFEIPDVGHHQLSFSVDGRDDEKELRNNQRSTLVEVANQSFRILYFEGEPRWEYKFMRRAMGGDDDVEIVSLLRVSPNKYYRQGIESPEELEAGFPLTRDELFRYDALIIGSVEAAFLRPAQQQLIAEFVSERGGSLLMLAGPGGLGNGGWGQSGIADVLPVTLPPASADSFFRKRAVVELTPQGSASEMLALAEDDVANLAAWRELPEIADYQLTGELKPATTVWLSARTDTGVQPLLLSQPFGRGHAYVLATGGTWRWQMSLPAEDQRHETFWRQLLRAMVASSPVNVSLTANVTAESENVALRAEFRDDAYRPVDDVGVTAVASHEDGATWTVELQPSADEPGVFVADFVPDSTGTWYFEAVAERNDEPVAVSRAGIHYETGQAEHFNIRRNTSLLQGLSEATGGHFMDVDNLDALTELLRYSSAGVTELQYRSIWDAPIVFILLLMLKAAEWLLRRRWSTI